MKKNILIVILLTSFGVFSQKEVAKNVSEKLAQNIEFKQYSVLSVSQDIPNNSYSRAIDKATFAKIKTQTVADLVTDRYDNIEVEIPYQGETIEVLLYKVNLFSEGFHVDTDKSGSIDYQQGVHYRGIVKGDLNSLVSFNFFKGELNGLISNSRFNNLVIGKLDVRNNVSDYIVYSDQNMKVKNTFECHTKDDLSQDISNSVSNTSKMQTSKCVSMYFEMDHDLFLANDGNTTTTSNWMTSVFNNVQTLFANEGITVSLKSFYIWTENDPFAGPGSHDYLYQFDNVRPVFDGDVGQLIGMDQGSLGGVAVGVNALCNLDNYSYSDVDFSFATVPTFSWTVMVITHEMGHLLGSPHTHACVWNGNNTAIDNCGSVGKPSSEGYACVTTPPTYPSAEEKGTIMSYCHIISDLGINLANGFGPQPAAVMISAVEESTCLSADGINTCINTVSEIQVADITHTGASITWTEMEDTSSWQISVSPFSVAPIWVSVTATNYDVSNLLPNTYYIISVHPNCGADLIAPSLQKVFVTDTNYCNGVVITDTGGEDGNYFNSENYVRTIIPNVADTKIKVTFSSFDLEKDYDYLYVYDGSSINATDLSAGGFTGTTIPGPFESTAADGSLTIEFYSDTNTVTAGYVAEVACVSSLGNKKFTPNIDFTYYPNPSNGLVSISSKTILDEVLVYNLEGRLLYQNKVNGLAAKVNMTSFAKGTYFFKLKFDGKEANFKILKIE